MGRALRETHHDVQRSGRWVSQELNPSYGLAAAAYAEATGGVILDCQEGRLMSPARAREVANDLEQNGPRLVEMILSKMQQSRGH